MTDGNHFACMQPIPYIADTNSANQQDEQLRTAKILGSNSHHNETPCITNLDVINKQYGRLKM